MTCNQLKGMALIVHALLPFVSGLAIVVLVTTLVDDVKDLVDGPVAQLSSRAAAIRTEAAKAGDAIESALAPIRRVESALAQAQQSIQNIPEQLQIPSIQTPPLDLRIQPRVSVASLTSPDTSRYAVLSGGVGVRPASHATADVRFRPALWRPDSQKPMRVVRAGLSLPKVDISKPSIPKPPVPIPVPSVRVEWHHRRVQLPAIPAVTVPVPGLRQVKGLLSQNAAILGELNQLVGMIPILETLRSHAATVIDNIEPWLRAISILGGKVLLLVALVVCLVAPIALRVYVVLYMRRLLEQLRTGWALLRRSGTTASLYPMTREEPSA